MNEFPQITIERYLAVLDEFQEIARNPSRQTEQRFKALILQITALRETLIQHGVSIEKV